MKYKYLRFTYAPDARDRSGRGCCKAELEVIMRRGPEFDKQLSRYLRRSVANIQKIRANQTKRLTAKLTGDDSTNWP